MLLFGLLWGVRIQEHPVKSICLYRIVFKYYPVVDVGNTENTYIYTCKYYISVPTHMMFITVFIDARAPRNGVWAAVKIAAEGSKLCRSGAK